MFTYKIMFYCKIRKEMIEKLKIDYNTLLKTHKKKKKKNLKMLSNVLSIQASKSFLGVK